MGAVALVQDLPVYKLTVNQITPYAASCHAGGCLERVNEMGDILQSRIRSYGTVGWRTDTRNGASIKMVFIFNVDVVQPLNCQQIRKSLQTLNWKEF